MTDTELKWFEQLEIVPVQGLIDKLTDKGVDLEEIKNNPKDHLKRRLISITANEQEIRGLIDQYAYGKTVSFALGYLNCRPQPDDFTKLKVLQGVQIPVEYPSFRNIEIDGIIEQTDRIEVLFKYSKRRNYLAEDETRQVVWEVFRGNVWVGKIQPYLAVVSKEEKIWRKVAEFISEKLGRTFSIIKPPIKAIESFLEPQNRCGITLLSENNEKTTIARAEGLSENQQKEVESLQANRLKVSGSYKTTIKETKGATVRYNSSKGTITIHKSIPSEDLMNWTAMVIDIILEEISNLNNKNVDEVFSAYGQKIEWNPAFCRETISELNWLLGTLVNSPSIEPFEMAVPESFFSLLDDPDFFIGLYRPYCESCESPVSGECFECSCSLTPSDIKRQKCPNGHKLFDGKKSFPICYEGHHLPKWSIEQGWFIPTAKLKKIIDKNIQKVKFGSDVVQRWFIANCNLFIKAEPQFAREVQFNELNICDPQLDKPTTELKKYIVSLKEKCDDCKSKSCLSCTGITDICLGRVISPLIPGLNIQPHKGGEYGDVSGQLRLGSQPIEFKGIIKSNSLLKSKKKELTIEDKINSFLQSTSTVGQEIIRQLIEQGLNDQRCQLVAIIVPQYIDNDFKGTLRFLCGLVNKKISFWEIDKLSSIAANYKRNHEPRLDNIKILETV
jgi:hypothetical protein